MRILAPASRPKEVETLVTAGADELYCGFQPSEWTDRHGPSARVNRRESQKANLATHAGLRELVERARELACPVHLTLNARSYTRDELPFLKILAAWAVDEVGIRGLIVADVGLLCALLEWRPDFRIHASSLAAVRNVEAGRLFQDLGAARLVLPRHVRIGEAAAMVRGLPGLEVEVFVLNDGCIYEEGHCSTIHGAGPICLTNWSREFRTVEGVVDDGGAPSLEVRRRNAAESRVWTAVQVGSASGLTPTGAPSGPCGLCAVPELLRQGVHSLKIVGREASTERKLRSIRQVRRILDLALEGVSSETCRAAARTLRGTPDLCRSGYGCYFPEVVESGEAPESSGKERKRE